MAEPEKLPETSEEVRQLKNLESSWSSKLSVAEDLDGRTHVSFKAHYSGISLICTVFINLDTLDCRSFECVYIIY